MRPLSWLHFGLGRANAELVVRLCLPPELAQPAVVASCRALTPEGWDSLAVMAEQLGLAPLFHHTLSETDLASGAPEPVLARLQQTRYAVALHNQPILAEAQQLLSDPGAGLGPLVVLKGAALLATVYPDTSLRVLADVDLLAADPAVGRRLAAAEQREITHGAADLHWGMKTRPSLWPLPLAHVEEMLERTEEVLLGDTAVQTLSPADHLLWLLWHDFCHADPEPDRLLDLAWLIHTQQARLDWEQVLDAAQRWGIVAACYPALQTLAGELGLAIPPAVISRCQAQTGLTWLRPLVGLDLWLWPPGVVSTQQWRRAVKLQVIAPALRHHRQLAAAANQPRPRTADSWPVTLRLGLAYLQAVAQLALRKWRE